MSAPPAPVPDTVPDKSLRVAVVQSAAAPLAVASNARAAAVRATEAARRGARLVLLPELHLCAYDLPGLAAHPDEATVRADHSRRVTDPRLEPLSRAAVERGSASSTPGRRWRTTSC